MKRIDRFLLGMALLGWLALAAADVSPWDAWRLGYTNFELGEQHRDRGEYTKALEAFQKALDNYQTVKRTRPDWNQRVIKERIADCERELSNLRRQLGAAGPVKPPPAAVKKLPGEVETLRKQLADAEAEIEKMRTRDAAVRNLEAEITHLMRDQRIAAEKYALLNQRYLQLEQQSKRPDSRVAELQNQLVELRGSAEIAANRLKIAEEKAKQLADREFKAVNSLRAAENALHLRDENISELNRQLEELRRSSGNTADRIRQLEAGVKAAEAKLAAERADHDKQLAVEQEKSRTALDAARSRADAAEKASREAAARAEKAESAVKRADARAETAEAAARKAEKEAASLRAAGSASTGAAAASDEKLAEELRRVREENDKLRAAEKASREAAENAEAAVSAARKAASDASLAVDAEVSARKNAEASARKAASEASAAARSENAMKQTLEEARQENDKLRRELAAVREDFSAREKEFSAMRRRATLAESNAEFNVIELAKLRDNTRRLEDELRAAVDKASMLDQRLKNRTETDLRRAAEADGEIKRLNSELSRANDELIQLRATGDELRRSGEKLKEEAARSAATIKQLRDERARLNKELQEAAAGRDQLGELPKLYAELQKNFLVLQAENKENRLRAEAAKPREAELAGIKLRLVELDQLKASLSREQRLVEELQTSRRTLEAEVQRLRPAADELAAAKRQLAEIAPLRQELERLRKLSVELAAAKSLEGELAQARLKLVEAEKLRAELDALRRKSHDDAAAGADETQKLRARIAALESETASLRKLGEELAAAKSLEGELAQAKLQVAEFAQVKEELARLTKTNTELEKHNTELEKQLADRPRLQIEGLLPVAVLTAPPEESPDDLVAAGVIARNDGRRELAAWNFRQALKGNPNHPVAAKQLGMLLYEQERFAEAVPLLKQARAAEPGDLALGIAAARSSIAVKNYGGALMILEPLIKSNPDNAGLQLALALAEAGSGETDRAENRIKFVTRLAPRDPAPRIELAKLLLTTDASRIQEAARSYESARLLGAPPDVDLEPKLGKMLDERRDTSGFLAEAAREAGAGNDWATAVWYYRRLLELDREPQRFAPRLAFAQYKSGNPAAALETLAFRKPATPEGALVAMMIHFQRGETNEALESAREAKKANQDRRVELPVDWSDLAVELERVFADRSNPTVRILRETYKVD